MIYLVDRDLQKKNFEIKQANTYVHTLHMPLLYCNLPVPGSAAYTYAGIDCESSHTNTAVCCGAHCCQKYSTAVGLVSRRWSKANEVAPALVQKYSRHSRTFRGCLQPKTIQSREDVLSARRFDHNFPPKQDNS